jgi:hypothetical protein
VCIGIAELLLGDGSSVREGLAVNAHTNTDVDEATDDANGNGSGRYNGAAHPQRSAHARPRV